MVIFNKKKYWVVTYFSQNPPPPSPYKAKKEKWELIAFLLNNI
jgi:hypothetical protein